MSAADIVGRALVKWSDAFARNDWDALTEVYSRNALLDGSTPQLYYGEGTKGGADRFDPHQRGRHSEFQRSY